MARQTVSVKCEKSRGIVDGALKGSPELKARLRDMGFDDGGLNGGDRLVTAAEEATRARTVKTGVRRGATARVKAQRLKIDKQFGIVGAVARELFEDNIEALAVLGLDEPHLPHRMEASAPASSGAPKPPDETPATRASRAQAEVLKRTRTFYKTALERSDILDALTQAGYPAARLQAEQADVVQLEELDTEQERDKGLSKGGTLNKKAALAAMDEWISRFCGVVIPQLSDRPDLLAEMGLKPRGGKA